MTRNQRLDAWLRRIQFRGRSLSLERFYLQTANILSKLFGRAVAIDGTDEVVRVLPVVWGKRIHLFGVEYEFLRADFTSKLELRLSRVPPVASTPGRPISARDGSGSVVHIMLCHLPARRTERLLRHAQALGKDYTVLLAYGGPKEQFDQVDWPHKIYLDDPTLRGPYWLMSYYQLINRARDYFRDKGIGANWIFIADFDLVPVRERYLQEVTGQMAAVGAGLAGKQVKDISLSNCPFLLNHVKDGRIGPDLNGTGKPAIYQSLGCGLMLHRECFDSLFHHPEGLSGAYYEVGALTEASMNGFRLMSLDAHGDAFKGVRFRPMYTMEEALAATAAGMPMLHPIKETDEFLERWKEAFAGKSQDQETPKTGDIPTSA